ncbi:hypothetical protein L0Y59_04265, partial [Candidatus Uhrbacteria bacterium]|nr:hypothetical protein [Candidatus Uhrbacteria bacterium]
MMKRLLMPAFAASALAIGMVAPAAALAASLPTVSPDQTRPGDVRVWTDGFSMRRHFSALPTTATGGGTVTAGDVDGDGTDEIVVGAGPGAQPYVNVFTNDGSKIRSFLAYASSFRGGI